MSVDQKKKSGESNCNNMIVVNKEISDRNIAEQAIKYKDWIDQHPDSIFETIYDDNKLQAIADGIIANHPILGQMKNDDRICSYIFETGPGRPSTIDDIEPLAFLQHKRPSVFWANGS